MSDNLAIAHTEFDDRDAYVSFSFDDLFILSATEDIMFVEGVLGHPDDNARCILIILQEEFHELLTAWLVAKSQYFDEDGSFAGVGFIDFCNVTKSEDPYEMAKLNDDPDAELEYEDVIAYHVSCGHVNMEHG